MKEPWLKDERFVMPEFWMPLEFALTTGSYCVYVRCDSADRLEPSNISPARRSKSMSRCFICRFNHSRKWNTRYNGRIHKRFDPGASRRYGGFSCRFGLFGYKCRHSFLGYKGSPPFFVKT